MEGFLIFKKGALRFWKAEMKKYYFVLTHNPTNAEFKYVLTWYKDENKNKLKGTLNIPASMQVSSGEHKQLFLGYYFQIKSDENELYHFSADVRDYSERWISKFREAIFEDVYAGITKANKFKEQTIINIYLTNNCIAFVHPITEETLLSWKLSQIVSFVFDQSEFSFVICSKCSKCSGRFTQEVTLQTSILIIGTMEDRISSIYADIPGAVITHEKNISGDVYRVPHQCRRIMDTKQEILYNTKQIPDSPSTFSKQYPSNRNARGNHLLTGNQNYIRSLNNSPVTYNKTTPLMGRNVGFEPVKFNSLPLSSQHRITTPGLETVRNNTYNMKYSFDENSSKNWHSNSFSHTRTHTVREPYLAEIHFPDNYQPKKLLAASLENLDVVVSNRRLPTNSNQSKWQAPSSVDTSDLSEILSQSNYSSSPYSSSADQSNHSYSQYTALTEKQQSHGRVENPQFFRSLPRNIKSLPLENAKSVVNHLPNESLSSRGYRMETFMTPIRCHKVQVADSDHVYSIPHKHSRSMELLNPPINTSANTSSSEYYEPMKSSVGVRHKPKHINTSRACKNRGVRKSVSKREPSNSSSFTSESSGLSSVSTDEGNAKKTYF